MDGLMFNTEDVYWHVGSEVLRRRGREYTRELCHAMMGCTPRSAFQTMIQWHALDDSCEQLARESEEVFIRLLDDIWRPCPGCWICSPCWKRPVFPRRLPRAASRGWSMRF